MAAKTKRQSFKKALLQKLGLWLLPPIGALLIRVIYHTSKKQFNLPKHVPEDPVIFAFWHGDLLLMPYLYYRFRKIPNANVMISDHFDGRIIARVMRFFRLGTIHGSSNRKAAKVLIAAMRTLKAGTDIGITPDGPRGPRYEVADGIVAMAQKTGAKVIVFNCVPSRCWRLKSWDRFVVPKPFGRLAFYASEPIDLNGLELDAAKDVVKSKLMEHALE
ncbi:lysophospholipid acyltransferase family protein [Sulfurimonas sp. HSL1-6]|uniref:lysophospholipid acyltransferase family protein n=1 Tax=Thiomicrolovo immobilis TaxID=3131935 RepID=UPI0031F7E3C3